MTVPVLHVAYGGLGGHVGVVVPLSSALAAKGIDSGVVAYAPADELAANLVAWSSLAAVVPVARRSRLDVGAMVAVVRATARLRPRVVLCHTLNPVPAAFVGMLLARRRPRLVLVEHQQRDLRGAVFELRTAFALLWVRATVYLTDDARRRARLRRLPLPGARRSVVVPTGVRRRRLPPGAPTGRCAGGRDGSPAHADEGRGVARRCRGPPERRRS